MCSCSINTLKLLLAISALLAKVNKLFEFFDWLTSGGHNVILINVCKNKCDSYNSYFNNIYQVMENVKCGSGQKNRYK